MRKRGEGEKGRREVERERERKEGKERKSCIKSSGNTNSSTTH